MIFIGDQDIPRLVPGVLGNEVSSETESFDDGLLEYPQYSRPEEWRCRRVPFVTISAASSKLLALKNSISGKFLMASLTIEFSSSGNTIFIRYIIADNKK